MTTHSKRSGSRLDQRFWPIPAENNIGFIFRCVTIDTGHMPKKLLVADDSLTIQKVIRLALSGAASGASDGYEIQTVSDGNDAIQQISLFRPDIVLIDVSLPGKSAFEVKRATNQHRDLAHVRFVLMSSAFEKVDEPQVSEVDFHGRLTKPFDPAHLREVLGQVLAKAPAPISAPPAPRAEQFTPPPVPSEFPPADFPPSDLPESEPQIFTARSPEPESDIRNLTESTIRMSGLADLGADHPSELPPGLPPEPEPPSDFPEDFQWSVEETSLKPPSNLDAGDSTFPLAPPPRVPNDHSRFIQRPKAEELELTPPPAPDLPYEEPEAFEAQPAPQAAPASYASNLSGPQAQQASRAQQTHPAPAAPSFDLSQIEEMVRREVLNAIRKVAQENLADAVERIVKEEIHKLLQDSP
jgi:CheY-like chemotaxis protein